MRDTHYAGPPGGNGSAAIPTDPPHNFELEQATLGALLLDNAALRQMPSLRMEHFFDPLHQRIFEVISAEISAGYVATPVSIKHHFELAPPIGDLTVAQYLGRLAANAATTINASHYARMVSALAQQRAFAQAGAALTAAANGTPSAPLLSDVLRDLDAIRAETLVSFPSFNAAALLQTKAPPRQWTIPDWMPHRDVTLLGADGGTGKTTLAIQLATACAAGALWMAREVTQCPVLYFSAEDDQDELHWRLERIVEDRATSIDLSGLEIMNLAGIEATLARPDRNGSMIPTPAFAALESRIKAIGAGVVILDSTADVFGGNENDRTQVRSFVTLLRALAIRNDCAVLLLAHPSVEGMKSGRGYSGSTHWNNSVRSRMYLTTPTAKDDDEREADPDLRLLELAKANRARKGQKIWMRWRDNLFHVDETISSMDDVEAQIECEKTFIAILENIKASGREPSPHKSTSYAPAMAAKNPEAGRFTTKDFERAMERLFGCGRIRVASYRKDGKQRSRIEIIE